MTKILPLIVVISLVANSAAREPWLTSRLVGSPEPQPPFMAQRMFDSVDLRGLVAMRQLPFGDLMLTLQENGNVSVFRSQNAAPQVYPVFELIETEPELQHTFDIELDPDFESNRFVYLGFQLKPAQRVDGARIVRYTLVGDKPETMRLEDRRDIFQWPSGGHCGSCLKFGPDGYLYFSAGDGSGPFPPDEFRTAQDITNVRGSILRIDVDSQDPAKSYAIPNDNPFVDHPGARGEIWAFGFRNPWRFSFDSKNGELYSGDVGWELWEMVHRVERGGNYGWSIMEGPQPIHINETPGPGPLLPPLLAIDHTESQSITGGFVYRGNRYPELKGTYIFGDWVNGAVWGIDVDQKELAVKRTLAQTGLKIVSFNAGRNGEIIILDHDGGIYELVPNTQPDHSADFPRRLSDTGLFRSTRTLQPAAGVIPYSPAAKMWLDGTESQAHVAVPGAEMIVPHRNPLHWQYPTGTVFAKTIFDRGAGDGERRRLETQILLFDGLVWNPYTYAWNDAQTDADLVPAEGGATKRTYDDPLHGSSEITYRFFSRTECRVCHTRHAGGSIGFKLENLQHHVGKHAGTAVTQLEALVQQGVLEPMPQRGPAFVDPYDQNQDLDSRARSYLAINCANCHRREGGGSGPLELPLDLPLAATNAIDVIPLHGAFGIPDARVIAPGAPFHSTLYYRISTEGPGHMPRLGGRLIDVEGMQLIHDWIANLSPTDPSGPVEGAGPVVGALRMATAANRGHADLEQVRETARAAVAENDMLVAGLLERFLPPEQRVERLGPNVDPDEILTLAGNAEEGRRWFLDSPAAQCRQCHRVDGVGRAVGPDLDGIAKERSRAKLLESLLEPSKEILPQYQSHLILTVDGQQHTGLIVKRTDQAIQLRAADGSLAWIPTDDIELQQPQSQSLMPSGLVESMTAQQLADLVAYLSSLR